MVGVVISPSSNKLAQRHYRDTILTEVSFTDPVVVNLLDKSDYNSLLGRFKSGKAMFWGTKTSNRTKYGDMRIDDHVLFTHNSRIISIAKVAYKFENAELATHLWSDAPIDQTWSLMFALCNHSESDISYKQLNKVIGDKPGNKHMGFRVLKEDAGAAFIEGFIDEQGPIGEPVSDDEYALIIDGDLDIETTSKRRKEQRYLKDHLLGSSQVSSCCMCGLELPVELLRAAHIKKRSECSRQEKLDFNIVMPACVLGCDSLYEDGWIVVDSTGTIQQGRGRGKGTGDLNSGVNNLVGNECFSHSKKNSEYFQWHYDKWA